MLGVCRSPASEAICAHWNNGTAHSPTTEHHIMKLYFSPGACSLSPHIVSREAGINVDLEQVDLREKKTKNGNDFLSVIPRDRCQCWNWTMGTN
jgi:hypothetical protein